MIEFNYAIQNAQGLFFAGTARSPDSRNWVDNSSFAKLAYTFTRQGAQVKMQAIPHYWKGCTVVRLNT